MPSNKDFEVLRERVEATGGHIYGNPYNGELLVMKLPVIGTVEFAATKGSAQHLVTLLLCYLDSLQPCAECARLRGVMRDIIEWCDEPVPESNPEQFTLGLVTASEVVRKKLIAALAPVAGSPKEDEDETGS